MAKNIVICCDGTANEFAKHRTNVVKLFSVLEQDADQIAYYHPGLGTMEPPGALTTLARMTTKGLGMAFGYGLANDVRDAYVFLTRNYQPGDKLFLFGFSRGAYTVRAVASLLHMYGLVPDGNEPLVPYITRMMMAITRAKPKKGSHAAALDDYFTLARDFKQAIGRTECKPWFVGIWDAVSSVGWVENPLKLPFIADNPDVAIGRHAVSIDEHRAFFRTLLWRPSSAMTEHGPVDVKQVWFPGVHCDVGGGYPEAESGLSTVALEWMLSEADAQGLRVNPARRREVMGADGGNRYVRPDATAASHESLTAWWHIAEFIPKRHYDWATRTEGRRMNLYRRRTIPSGSLVHESAFQRGGEYLKRLPPDVVPVKSQHAEYL